MRFRRLQILPAVTTALAGASGTGLATRALAGATTEPRVVFLTEEAGCSDSFSQALCDGFVRAVARTGVSGRVVTPTPREDIVDTLELIARQRHDLVVGTGDAYLYALSQVRQTSQGSLRDHGQVAL